MKKQLILLISLFFLSSINAQVRIGNFDIASYSHGKISKSLLEDFKKSTTYFVINEDIGLTSDEVNTILKDIWTVTPFEVVAEKERFTYLKEGNSLVYFEGFTITKTKSNGTGSGRSFIYFDIFMPEKIKKKKNGEYKFNRNRLGALYFSEDLESKKEGITLLNYKKGYLKNAFQNINKNLLKSESVDIYTDFQTPKIKALRKKTLYLSEAFMYGYSNGEVTDKYGSSEQELFADYKYKHKVVTDEELNKMILENEEPFYYLVYNLVNSNKILNIVNSKTGEVIFQEHKKMSFLLKPKDIKQLSKTIEKAK